MNRIKLWIGILVLGLGFACTSVVQAADLTVAAAANLQSTIQDLKAAYEAKEGGSVKVVTSSSGSLTTQIENGAPFDVFLSADMKYPETLYKEGLSSQPPKVYAYGVLVLWTTKKDLQLSKDLNFLTDPAIKKIALANPQAAPYGREAVNALKYSKVYESVQKKLVYGENISQTTDFIATQAADVGLTAKSMVLSPNLKEKGTWVEVPAEAYNRIAQGCVILKYGEKNHSLEAQKFYDFLFSPQAKTIFEKYGYLMNE